MTMDLTAMAIEKIEQLAVDASGAKSFLLTGEASRVRIFNSKTGTVEYQEIPELPPELTVCRLADLAQASLEYGDVVECTVWVSSQSVTVLFDRRRIGKATLPLRINPAINILQLLRDLTPAQLRKHLTVALYGTDIKPFDFTECISNLKFESTQTNETKLAKGDESIGKSVRSKVTAEWQIPDRVSFRLPVYPDLSELDTVVEIECAVLTDASAGTVSVVPYPGQVELALRSAIERIATHLNAIELDGDDTHRWSVYCGTCK